MSKKLIALLLLVALVVGCALTGCKKDDNNPTGTTKPVKVVREIKKGTKVILGNTTELSGDFRWPGFRGRVRPGYQQTDRRLRHDGNRPERCLSVERHLC